MTSLGPDTPLVTPPPGVVSDFAHPVNQQHYDQIVATMSIIVPLSTIAVLLRLWTRIVLVRRAGWDDAFALLALVRQAFLIPCEGTPD